MQQSLRGTVILLVALARPVHAQENMPYTTYTDFNQVLEGIDARYPAITRVSDPGTSTHPIYASPPEFVGEFWLGEVSELVI